MTKEQAHEIIGLLLKLRPMLAIQKGPIVIAMAQDDLDNLGYAVADLCGGKGGVGVSAVRLAGFEIRPIGDVKGYVEGYDDEMRFKRPYEKSWP